MDNAAMPNDIAGGGGQSSRHEIPRDVKDAFATIGRYIAAKNPKLGNLESAIGDVIRSINAGAHTDAQTSNWKQRLQQGLNGIRSRSAGGSCTAAHPEHVSEGSGSTSAGTLQAITGCILDACCSLGTATPSTTLDGVSVAAQQAQGVTL